MDEKNINHHLMSIILMLASACWQQLGKIPNPVDNKVEVDLEHAQITIDILEMLKEKTKGNLTTEEDKLLSNTIADLQLNYADEANRKNASEHKH
ncbi:MAG: DUF1844 domain-containing protein [Elusimicrobiota bacterium]